MIISGFKQRNFYNHSDEFNYSIDISLSNLSGYTEIGFSGINQSINLKFIDGAIYNDDNNLIYYYNVNSIINISGNVNSYYNDLFINGDPFHIGKANLSTGKQNYFYINTQNVLSDINCTILGDVPTYYLDSGKSYNSGENIPIKVINSGNDYLSIFSGDILNNTKYSFSGLPLTGVYGTGLFYIIPNNYVTSEDIITANLYTNFGDFSTQFYLNINLPNLDDWFITLGPQEFEITNGSIQNYVLTFNSTGNFNAQISLEHISGHTGETYSLKTQTGLYESLLSGYVTGSGLLQEFISEIVISGFNSLNSQYELGTGSGVLNTFGYLTGFASGTFNLLVTGLGSGIVLNNILFTGWQEINQTITINYPSTEIILTGDSIIATGLSEFGLVTGILTFGSSTITIPYTGGVTGNFVSGEYELITITGEGVLPTGEFSKTYTDIFALGYATGDFVSGKAGPHIIENFVPGDYLFRKYFSGQVTGQINSNFYWNLFDIITCETPETGLIATGIISGHMLLQTGIYNCDFDLFELKIPVTGTPQTMYINGTIVDPFFFGVPRYTGTLSIIDSLESQQSGNITFTQISRAGVTPSGSGSFYNIFEKCFYPSGYWIEKFEDLYTFISGSGNSPIANYIELYSNIDESGISRLSFEISGASKNILLQGLSQEISKLYNDNPFYNINYKLNLYLQNNTGGLLYSFSGRDISTQTDTFFNYLPDNQPSKIITLDTGTYHIYAARKSYFSLNENSNSYIPPTDYDNKVFFRNQLITGFEDVGTLRSKIQLQYINTAPVSVYLNFVDLTASSGIDYNIVTGITIPTLQGFKDVEIPIINRAGIQSNRNFLIFITGTNFSNITTISGYNYSLIDIYDKDLHVLTNCCGGFEQIIHGCTDPDAINYNPLAVISDESCLYQDDINNVDVIAPDDTNPPDDTETPSPPPGGTVLVDGDNEAPSPEPPPPTPPPPKDDCNPELSISNIQCYNTNETITLTADISVSNCVGCPSQQTFLGSAHAGGGASKPIALFSIGCGETASVDFGSISVPDETEITVSASLLQFNKSASQQYTVNCYVQQCCCPGENGSQCGEDCCCCDIEYAPIGPECSCVWVGPLDIPWPSISYKRTPYSVLSYFNGSSTINEYYGVDVTYYLVDTSDNDHIITTRTDLLTRNFNNLKYKYLGPTFVMGKVINGVQSSSPPGLPSCPSLTISRSWSAINEENDINFFEGDEMDIWGELPDSIINTNWKDSQICECSESDEFEPGPSYELCDIAGGLKTIIENNKITKIYQANASNLNLGGGGGAGHHYDVTESYTETFIPHPWQDNWQPKQIE